MGWGWVVGFDLVGYVVGWVVVWDVGGRDGVDVGVGHGVGVGAGFYGGRRFLGVEGDDKEMGLTTIEWK